jgi:triosephosphate isomerase
MNNTISDAEVLVTAINKSISNINKEDLYNIKVLVCPAFINLHKVTIIASGTPIFVGAQNCYSKLKGAYTGEVSPNMLKAVGCQYCIVGHSERRRIFNETGRFINSKIKLLLEKDITPILCIGETQNEREAGSAFHVLQSQLIGCLDGIDGDDVAKIVVAYEPVWAIGTGIAATCKEIEESHNWIRNYFTNNYGDFISNQIFILYGGSLNDNNAAEIFAIKNVNGGLIGGASLVADKFISIINTAIKISKEQGYKPPCSCGCN